MSFNRPSSLKRETNATKGPSDLWAEGRQQPLFNLRAFARVSIILSRRAARPVLIGLAGALVSSARGMANNTLGPRLAQMGRLGRALPMRTSIASGLVRVAAMMSAAADVMVPPPPVSVPLAYPEMMRTPVSRTRRAAPRLADHVRPPALSVEPPSSPEPPPKPAPDTEFDHETITAIRAMIASMREPVQVTPRRPDARVPEPEPPLTGRELFNEHIRLEPPEPRPPTRRQLISTFFYGVTAAAIGWSIAVITFPLGAFRALLLHLNGEDLRTWN